MACKAFKITFASSSGEARINTGMVHNPGFDNSRSFNFTSPSIPTALLEPEWKKSVIVLDKPHYVSEKKEHRPIPEEYTVLQTEPLLRAGVPLSVVQALKSVWESEGTHLPASLYKQTLLKKFFELEKRTNSDERHAGFLRARQACIQYLCPSSDRKAWKEAKRQYTLDTDGHLVKWASLPRNGEKDHKDWVMALTGLPHDACLYLWDDHVRVQLHPGKVSAAANLHHLALTGRTSLGTAIIDACEVCNR